VALLSSRSNIGIGVLLALTYISPLIFYALITYAMMATEQAAFLEILQFIAAALLLVGVGSWLTSLLRLQRPNSAKLHTYESGEEPTESAWKRFNTCFYVIAIVFIIFEIETVLLYPWATVWADPVLNEATEGLWATYTTLSAVLFVALLVLGFAYTWRKGHLANISPPGSPPSYFISKVPKARYDRVNDRYASITDKAATQTNN